MNDDGRLDDALRRAFRGSTARDHEPDEPPPDVAAFEERYAIHEVIGEGGMGVVHRATDRLLEREVAVKFLRADHGGTAAQIRRFISEARLAARVVHPGVVPIYDRGVTADGRPYIAMRLVHGRTLKQRLLELGDDPNERRKLVSVIERVAQAVAAAHAVSVIHRDLKPSNVMLGQFGEVLVMDFGLARQGADDLPIDSTHAAAPPSAAAPGMTHTGAILGTPAYMSPEQEAGRSAEVGPQADVYAIGAMLFELFAPDRPVETDAIRNALATGGCDPGLANLIVLCLATDPKARPSSAAVVAEEIVSWSARQEQRAAEARELAALASARLDADRRRRRLVVAVVLVCLLAAVLIGLVMLQAADERATRQKTLDAEAITAITAAEVAVAKAEGGPLQDVGPWREARTLAGIAAERAEAASVADVIAHATKVRAAALAGLTRAEKEAATLAADDAMVRRLDAISAWAPTYRDWPADVRAYEEAFAAYGMPITAGDAESIRGRLQTSRIRRRLVRALLDYARASEAALGPDSSARRLFEIARDAEDRPEPKRWIELRLSGKPDELLTALRSAELSRLEPQALAFHCEWLLQTAPVGDVIDVSRRIQEAHPGSPDAQMTLERALEMRGRPEDFAEAARCASAGAALVPGDPHMLCVVATCLRRAGHVEEGEALLRRLKVAHPTNLMVAHFLGLCLHEQERYPEAVAEYERAVSLGSSIPETLCNLATILSAGSDPRRAERIFRGLLNTAPRLIEGRIGLGRLLTARGVLDEAIAFLGGVVRDAPTSSFGWLAYGQALSLRHRYKGAADAYERFRALATPAELAKLPLTDKAIVQLRAHERRLASIPIRSISDPDEVPDTETLGDLAQYYCDRNDPETSLLAARLVIERSESKPDPAKLWTAIHAALALSRKQNRPELRAEAMRWLEQSFDWTVANPTAAESRRTGTVDLLDWWLRGAPLRFVRDAAFRDGMPADEAAKWDRLFQRIREARARLPD